MNDAEIAKQIKADRRVYGTSDALLPPLALEESDVELVVRSLKLWTFAVLEELGDRRIARIRKAVQENFDDHL